MSNLIKSIMAGISISFAGIAYLSSSNSFVGAFLFSLGLLAIYHFDWNLFTGKACYFLSGKKGAVKLGAIAILGNAIGCIFMGYLMRITKLIHLEDHAIEVVECKLANTPISGFIMAIGCGFMMYLAVIGYANHKCEMGKFLMLILPIIVFTISGFEHVVANLFYFSFTNVWDFDSIVYILIVLAGNTVGCSIIPISDKLTEKFKK